MFMFQQQGANFGSSRNPKSRTWPRSKPKGVVASETSDKSGKSLGNFVLSSCFHTEMQDVVLASREHVTTL
jgi:hypothetical protein